MSIAAVESIRELMQLEFEQYSHPAEVAFSFDELAKTSEMRILAFVEGASDEQFYASIAGTNFPNNVFFIPANSKIDQLIQSETISAKKAVIFAYLEIKEKQPKGITLDKCIFIVDRDYEPNLHTYCSEISMEELVVFNITPYHSVENFYCTKENLKRIFSKLERRDLDFFVNLIDEFSRDVIKYFILSSVFAIKYKGDWPSYRKRHKEDDIFYFYINSKGKMSFDRKSMEDEIKHMEQIVIGHKEAHSYYSGLMSSYNGEPGNIKGHIVFNLLKEYLNMVDNESDLNSKQWQKRLKGMTKLLEVQMKFVNGKGATV